ncbi:MAG: FadR/GntR family transcriptional regulator [Candidatus Dormibacteria bacterium]
MVLSATDQDVVTAVLERAITEGGLGPGDRLPTERELAENTGAGRAAVRQALACMEAEGRLVRQVGRGTFLAPRAVPVEAQSSGLDASPIDIMTVRAILEPGMMALAAVAATGSDFAEMERCLQGGDAADDYMAWEAWDAALHRSLVVATHNSFLVRIGEMVSAARQGLAWGGLKRRNSSPEQLIKYRSDHHAIVRALVERNGSQAQRAMHQHLQQVSRYLLGEHPGAAPVFVGESIASSD